MRSSLSCAFLLHLWIAGFPGSLRAGDEMIPLIDLGPGLYQGEQGGLYAGGVNTPPADHLNAVLQRAAEITPRNAIGDEDPDGLIAFAAFGMSNTTQEFGAFHYHQEANAGRNARLILVNTAQGGIDSTKMSDPDAPYWSLVDSRLAAAGVSPQQVQVAWLKQAKQGPSGDFLSAAAAFRDALKTIVQILHQRFPNLKLCYLSSRIYAGYATGSGNPEPYAYESGFAVKWLIDDQIQGDPDLNDGQLPGDVRAPLLLWGPYLWANGAEPNGNGTFWLPEDFEQGGTNAHPSPLGEQKVADLLSGFFANDPTAQAWWPKQPGEMLIAFDATDDAYVRLAEPDTNFGSEPQLFVQGGASTQTHTFLRFDLGDLSRPVIKARLVVRGDENIPGGRFNVVQVADSSWSESTITYAGAPALEDVVAGPLPAYSRGSSLSVGVSTAVSAGGGALSFALAAPPPPGNQGESAYVSREDGQPPRLVLSVVDVPEAIPVILEWGFIILALLALCLASVILRDRKGTPRIGAPAGN